MQKWEYLHVAFLPGKDKRLHLYTENEQQVRDWERGPVMHEYIRQLGDQGWELVTAPQGNIWIFKRPKQ